MTNYNENAGMMNGRALFRKELKNLFYIQIGMLVLSLLSEIPLIGTALSWGSRILSIGIIVVLFHIAPLNQRYRKAAIFRIVELVCVLIYVLGEVSFLSLVISICNLLAVYQEYTGHSEMIHEADAKLSGKWHSLFNWQIISGVILGALGTPIIIVIGVVASIETALLTTAVLVLFIIVDAILRIVYLVYLKRMQRVYDSVVPNQEDFI